MDNDICSLVSTLQALEIFDYNINQVRKTPETEAMSLYVLQLSAYY